MTKSFWPSGKWAGRRSPDRKDYEPKIRDVKSLGEVSVRIPGVQGLVRFGLKCSIFAAVVSSLTAALFAQVQVLTQHNDLPRTGSNTSETYLKYSNVNSSHFGKLFTESVDGFIVGQPLYVPALQFPDGTTHNVVYVTTQHDSVYAFDADTARGALWHTTFINPAAGITSVPSSSYGCPGTAFTEVGITSTPVIDPATGGIYVVAKTLENGAYIFRLHALSLTTGLDIVPPAVITASANSKSGTVPFTPAVAMQRAGLLLSNSAIYIGFGSNGCDAYNFHGWLLAYDEFTLQKTATILVTPDGSMGGVWQSGGAPAADSDGTIFLATGNGTFDGNSGGNDWGDSVLHLNPASSGMNVIDYFTPYNQQTLFTDDADLGSSGPLLLPDQAGIHTHELVAGGKAGTLYLIDRDAMGGYNSAADSQIVQSIPGAGELHQIPTYWSGNLFIGGENDYLKAFALSNGMLSPQPTSQTTVLFNQAGPGTLSVSSDPSLNNGIVWALIHGASVSYLYAFKATNLATQLYASNQAANLRDLIKGVPHFSTPTLANGKVYLGGTNLLYVFGLLPSLSSAAGNNQSGYLGATLPIALAIAAKNTYSGSPLANVPLTCKDGGVGGTFSNSTPITNAQGQAFTTYTLPNKKTNITITCVSPGYISATFSESAVAGPAIRIGITSGNYQVVPVFTKTPNALVATVYDPHSYGVSGVTVNFSDGGAGGTFSAPSSPTGSNGQASTYYTTPAKSGVISISASVAGLTPATFKVTAYGTAVRMAITTGNNQTTSTATQLPIALGVAVYDSNNIGVPGVTVIFSDGGAGGSFSPSTVITNNQGRASAYYTTPAKTGTFNITATASGLTPLTFKVNVN